MLCSSIIIITIRTIFRNNLKLVEIFLIEGTDIEDIESLGGEPLIYETMRWNVNRRAEGASTMLLINARNAPRPFRSASASRCTRNVAEPLLIDQAARFIIYYRVRRLVWETGQDKYFVNAWIKSMVIYWLDVIILSSCRKIDRDSKVYPRCVQTAAKVFEYLTREFLIQEFLISINFIVIYSSQDFFLRFYFILNLN